MKTTLAAAAIVLATTLTTLSSAQANDVKLIAAGSLRAALGDVVKRYVGQTGNAVVTTFGPSGLMRKRIEGGENHHIFASANMKHPQALNDTGLSGQVILFARNKLCALAQPDLKVNTETLLQTLLNPDVRVGTSTPNADPSGDYAFALFGKAEALSAGATAILEAKALQLTGGENSEPAPDGHNQYGWVMEGKKADIFLTYCTNAVLAKREVASLQIIIIPAELSVGANYGLTVLNGAPSNAQDLASFILSADGQKILADYGFDPVAE